jgi:hypothetical protein
LLTSSTARLGRPVSVTVQLASAPSSAATAANRARSSSASKPSELARTTCRVKNQFVSGSEW